MLGILASRADDASVAIAEAVLAEAGVSIPDGALDRRYRLPDAELVVVDDLHIELDAVDGRFEGSPTWIGVVSRHQGETDAILTAHFPGNVADADFGGRSRTVPPACPAALDAYLDAVAGVAPPGYDVALECTHHGPTDCATPIMFVEIGSSPAEWADPAAAGAVADALWSVRSSPARGDLTVVGIGGGHYAPRYRRLLAETDWSIGHVAADWALEALDDRHRLDVLRQLFDRSGATYAHVLGDRPGWVEAVESLGRSAVSEGWLRAASALTVPVLEALETALEPVDDGLAVGDRRVAGPEVVTVLGLSERLVEECAGIDRAATVEVVASATVAYATDGEGSRPRGPVAVPEGASLDDLRDGLVDILGRKYGTVRVDGDAVEATRRRFDPDLARERGVPPGPRFGDLAEGRSVEVDGERIDPASVSTEETVSFDLLGGV